MFLSRLSYPAIDEMIKIFNVDGFNEVKISDPKIGLRAVIDTQYLAILLYQRYVMLSQYLNNIYVIMLFKHFTRL